MLAVCPCPVSSAVCTSSLTNRDYFSPNFFFKMMQQFPNSILVKKKKESRYTRHLGFSGGSVVKNPPANAGDL